ncbi:MAG: hypothetical protein FWG84_04795 [Bacteroidales bacterium]|nr:hypothetical protein [Bacteroidales bacterium]
MAYIGENEAKWQQKSRKRGRKSCFSDYGHGYRLGYCCSTDEFHVFFQIVG